MKRPAIFVDRDGTIIEEVNFLSRVEDLRIFDFTAKAIADLKAEGYLIIVITNQSGISRGILSEADILAIHDRMQCDLDDAVDAFYFCPHSPDEGCTCRKPGSKMIEQARRDFEIDMEKSWVIGDKKIDVETGQRLDLSTALVLTGYGETHRDSIEPAPTIIAKNFGEAASRILAR